MATRYYFDLQPKAGDPGQSLPDFDSGWRYTREATRHELVREPVKMNLRREYIVPPIPMHSAALIPGVCVPHRFGGGWGLMLVRRNYEEDSWSITSSEGTFMIPLDSPWSSSTARFRVTSLLPEFLKLNRFNSGAR